MNAFSNKSIYLCINEVMSTEALEKCRTELLESVYDEVERYQNLWLTFHIDSVPEASPQRT